MQRRPRHHDNTGSALIEFGFILWPLIVLIFMSIFGGILVAQHRILSSAARSALVLAARIDDGVTVATLSDNQQVACMGVATGVPACGLLSASRYQSIVAAASEGNPFFSPEKMIITYGKYPTYISVDVALSSDSFLQTMFGEAGMVTEKAATAVAFLPL